MLVVRSVSRPIRYIIPIFGKLIRKLFKSLRPFPLGVKEIDKTSYIE
ncbi:MAG: hypothetical protein CLLPBCKN_006963 [Chroococcidiopsis cubana SAG 39.79]|nr:hypothetical protein [Chroococcidiopsis cubana SAG 39.79]